jgi:hypothetical protein
MRNVAEEFFFPFIVTTAKAGVQGNCSIRLPWMPAFAGMTFSVVFRVKA